MAYNYFASPWNSPRARAFRKKYGGAPLGQDFMFEGQPYARPGPASLLAEEGAGTATGYVEKPLIPETDRAYMTPEMLAAIAEKEANRKRLGARIGGRTKVLRDQSDWDRYVRRWVEPDGSFAQSPHALDTLEQERLIGNSTPSYLATSPKSERYILGHQNIITQDRLNKLIPKETPPMEVANKKGGLLYDEPDTNDKSGWFKSERYNNALAEMLLQWGIDQSKGEEWDDWG
jgi:hypothetical protein